MRIAVLTEGFPPAYLGGGPIRSLEAMLSSFPDNHEVCVLTNNYDIGKPDGLVADGNKWHRWNNVPVRYLPRGLYGLATGLVQLVRFRPEVIYVNSLFAPRLSIPFQILAAAMPNTQLVIAPRGELDPGALAQKPFKKNVFLRVLKLSRVVNNAIWHATSKLELQNVEINFGRPVEVVVRQNDTMLPAHAIVPPESGNRLKVVALSRISPKKGIDILLNALRTTSAELDLDIIGPAEDRAYMEKCKMLAARCSPSVRVRFLGTIEHELIVEKLGLYDVMACPTLGENFGHVIAESLAAAVPVMCADVTPWTHTLRSGAGVVVDKVSSASWKAAVEDYVSFGTLEWSRRRTSAATAYDEWRLAESNGHLFDLIERKKDELCARKNGTGSDS